MQCHSVQCVSKCARPVCSSAPQTACQASGCSAFIPGGAAFCSVTPNRWISRVGKTISENTPRAVGSGRIAKPSAIHRGNFAVAHFLPQDLLRWMRCVGLRFSPPPQIQPIGSRDQNGTNLDVQWEYCQVSKDKKRECRLDLKAKERRTGITGRQHIKEQIHTAVVTFGGCQIQEVEANYLKLNVSVLLPACCFGIFFQRRNTDIQLPMSNIPQVSCLLQYTFKIHILFLKAFCAYRSRQKMKQGTFRVLYFITDEGPQRVGSQQQPSLNNFHFFLSLSSLEPFSRTITAIKMSGCHLWVFAGAILANSVRCQFPQTCCCSLVNADSFMIVLLSR